MSHSFYPDPNHRNKGLRRLSLALIALLGVTLYFYKHDATVNSGIMYVPVLNVCVSNIDISMFWMFLLCTMLLAAGLIFFIKQRVIARKPLLIVDADGITIGNQETIPWDMIESMKLCGAKEPRAIGLLIKNGDSLPFFKKINIFLNYKISQIHIPLPHNLNISSEALFELMGSYFHKR